VAKLGGWTSTTLPVPVVTVSTVFGVVVVVIVFCSFMPGRSSASVITLPSTVALASSGTVMVQSVFT
jgi:hypothetical protein